MTQFSLLLSLLALSSAVFLIQSASLGALRGKGICGPPEATECWGWRGVQILIVGLLLFEMPWCTAGGSPTKASKLNVNAPVWIGSPSKAPASGAALSPVRTSSACSTIPAVSIEVRNLGHATKTLSSCRYAAYQRRLIRQHSLQGSQPVLQCSLQ